MADIDGKAQPTRRSVQVAVDAHARLIHIADKTGLPISSILDWLIRRDTTREMIRAIKADPPEVPRAGRPKTSLFIK